MKPEESRIPVKHEFAHAVPTVIHDPEQDMPLLAKWVNHAMDNPVRFWGTIAGATAALVLVSVLANGLAGSRAASDQAWTKLESARTPAERVEIAKDFPSTPAGRSALLQAATEYYNQGFNDLPANKDVALPTLKKALDQFEKVASEAPADSAQARAAALGVARTFEARNELSKALEQYAKVAKTWPASAEGRNAARFAAVLKTPEAVAFYKELYSYKATEATIPPGGISNIDLSSPIKGPGGGAPTGAGAGVSNIPMPDMSKVPPPPPSPTPKAEAPKTIDLKVTPAPKTEAPKADAGLPGEVSTKDKDKPEGAAGKK